jgi:hypothetical protein
MKQKEPTGKSTKKSRARWILRMPLWLLAFLLLLVILVNLSPVQTLVARWYAGRLSSRLNTEISLRSVHLNLFGESRLTGLLIRDLSKDTLLYAGELGVNLDRLRTARHIVGFSSVRMEDTRFYLKKYKDTEGLNLKFLIDYFSSPDTMPTEAPAWHISVDSLMAGRLRFVFRDEKVPPSAGVMHFNDLDVSLAVLKARGVVIEGDTVLAEIGELAAKEKCGFDLRSLSGKFRISPVLLDASAMTIITEKSNLKLEVGFSYEGYGDFSDFLDRVLIQAEIDTSLLDLSDIGYFAPDLLMMDDPLTLAGQVRGTVSNFKAKDFRLAYGASTRFRGDIKANGLPNIEETFIHLSIQDFITNAADIESFTFPVPQQHLLLPDQLSMLGNISIRGKFTGFYNDFVSNAVFYTDLGKISTDLLLKEDAGRMVGYNGSLAADRLDIGKLLSSEEYLGKVNVQAKINGRGITIGTAAIRMDAVIDSLEFRNNSFNNIRVTGELAGKVFSGNVDMEDELAGFSFDGTIDYSKPLPSINCKAAIKDACLNRLNIVGKDSTLILSTTLALNFTGDKPDNIQGIIEIDSTRFSVNRNHYTLDHLMLLTTKDTSDFRLINIYSDVADASLEGKYSFSDLPGTFARTLNLFLDTLVADTVFTGLQAGGQDFTFSIKIKDADELARLFMPGLDISSGSKLQGHYRSQTNDVSVGFESSGIDFRGSRLRNSWIKAQTMGQSIVMKVGCDQLILSDTIAFDSVTLSADIRHDSVRYDLRWDNRAKHSKNNGNIGGYADFRGKDNYSMHITRGEVYINDTLWTIDPDASVSVDSNSWQVDNLNINRPGQALSIKGIVSENKDDALILNFHDFDLSHIDFLTAPYTIDLSGVINGSFKIADLYRSPNLLADLRIDNFHFNQVMLGDVNVNTAWNDVNKQLDVKTTIEYTGNIGTSDVLRLEGVYKPLAATDQVDLDIALQDFNLETLGPFVSSFSSRVGGLATGNLRFKGTLNQPELTGSLKLKHAMLKIDYINTTYFFADQVNFTKNLISFDQVIFYDSLSNKAIGSGRATHNYFRDVRLDLNFAPEKLACLNLTQAQNEVFYGKASATGNVKISGPLNNLTLDIEARTEKGTQVFLPVSTATEVLESDYIIFLSDDKTDTLTKPEYEPEITGLNLSFKLTATPDAEVQIFLPYGMGNIKAKGNGMVHMLVDPRGNFSMDGDYIVEKGSFFFTVQKMINRYFEIRKGGRLSWDGDPYDADIDLQASYKIRTTLGSLGPESDSALVVPVDCIIYLSNKLLNPEIRFSLHFPELDESIRQVIYSRLDTNDQVAMGQQMVSLLVLNSFSMKSGYTGAFGFNSFSLLSNQLNNWLSDISKNIDIGINYRAGDRMTNEELELALSTQLFNDRVSIDGNIGYITDQNTQNTSSLVGDVQVEVKITPDGRFRIKAYNKSNYDYFLEDYSPYTQGVGVFYRKEFNRWGDLLKRQKKKPGTSRQP